MLIQVVGTGITGQDGSYLTELLLEKGEHSANGPVFSALEDCLMSAARPVLGRGICDSLTDVRRSFSIGYQVHGIIRRSSSFNTGRIEHLYRDSHERKFQRHCA